MDRRLLFLDPDLAEDNHYTDQPYMPEDGYHLSKDLADKAWYKLGWCYREMKDFSHAAEAPASPDRHATRRSCSTSRST